MPFDSNTTQVELTDSESSPAVTAPRKALPDDPMEVHSSRKVYFERLEADPYGFNDAAYDWPQDTRFAIATAVFYTVVLCGTLSMARAGFLPAFNPEALGYFAGALVFLFAGKCLFSWLVLRWKIKINYVRKLGLRPWKKLAAFVVPLLITKGSTMVTDWVVLFSVGSLVGLATESYWGRSRVRLFAYAYVSWDRIEDRPYSMRYDQIEDLFRFAIYLPFMFLLGESSLIVLIPNLVNQFGDGLAEPIGIRFGKHKYRTRAIWYDGKFWSGNFVRSIEGSTAVFGVTLLILFFYSASFSPTQYIITLAALPPLMTIAEAISPHTGDGPLIALVGCSFLWLVQFL